MDNSDIEHYENLGYLPPPPNIAGVTIYGKSDCIRCDELKDLLEQGNINYEYINCDEYLISDKEKFKEIMFEYMRINPIKKVLYFPVCFVDNIYFSSMNRFFYNAEKKIN